MNRSRRKLVRKSRESCQFPDRGGSRSNKNEGNSNITSKRLTIPPGFLCFGITSNSIRESKDKENSKTQRDYILGKDLHGLFDINLNENVAKPRRSSRILKKIEEAQNLDHLSASDYYSKVLTRGNIKNNKQSNENFCKNKPAQRNNSKSLFRKINERCAMVSSQNTIDLNCFIRPVLGENVKVEVFKATPFCKNLTKEIRVDLLDPNNILYHCKLAVSKKTQNINNILCGKTTSEMEVSENYQNKKLDNDRNEQLEDRKYFEYIPSCDWIYETPPRQRITMPKMDECAIQPAIICTTKKQSNIYELNPGVDFDLANYANRQNVAVDKRYLKHLASFEDKMQVDFGMQFLEPTRDQNRGGNEGRHNVAHFDCFPSQKEHSNREFSFSNPFVNVPENHFLAVTARPTKTVQKVSRINNILKRKFEEIRSTPTCSNHNQTAEQFETDFTFMEDDGKFKIVSTQCSVDNKDFNFQFKKNVFKVCEEEKIFNFKKEEPKMFDFSQLERTDR